jgi:stress response protein YsnF
VEIRLDDGHRVTLPGDLVRPSPSGRGYEVPLGPEDLRSNRPGQDATERVVVPVVREEAEVRKRTEETGSVVVHVVPRVQTEQVNVPLIEESVEVERVPVNRFVSGTQPVRQEGDVTVYEEVLVVERRLMLKEEVRVTRRRVARTERQRVELRTEEVRVLKSGKAGEQ